MFAFKSLQQRLIVLLIVPLILFLLGFGFFGYRFIQGLLFKEWEDIAILRLERAAHQLDMRLHGQMQWMERFAQAGQDPHGREIQGWLLEQMKSQPGVTQVKLIGESTAGLKGRTAIAGAIRQNVSHQVLLSAGWENRGAPGRTPGSGREGFRPP